MTLEINDTAPNFTLPANNNQTISLADYRGSYVVLFFYPKDDTSGCTAEALAFSEYKDTFKELNCHILGLSKDSVKSHDKFVEKYTLTIPLLSDEATTTLQAYGAWVEKSMYGKKYMGADRSTFIIDTEGKLLEIYRNVKVPLHAETVLKRLRELTQSV
jgi:thioredoxin-dependent peroxiredoxin